MFNLFITSSLEKILPKTAFTFEKKPFFSGLEGETLSFQIVYSADEDGIYKFKLEDDGLIEKKCSFVKNVAVGYATHPRAYGDENYTSHEPGIFPDILEPADRDWVYVNNIYSSIWVSVKAASGDHTVRVSFIGEDGETAATAKVRLRVLKAALPKQELIFTQWFHADCIADYYGYRIFSEEHWQMIRGFLHTARENGINMILTPVFTPPLDTAVGHERPTVQLVKIFKKDDIYEFDFSLLRRWTALCGEVGFEYYEIPHLFAQWGVDATPKIVAEVDGEEKVIFGWKTKSQSEEYESFLSQFLPALIYELKQENVFGNTYFHISDEPFADGFSRYCAAQQIALKYLKGCKVFDAVSENIPEGGNMKIPVLSTSLLAKGMNFESEERWCYYCNADCVNVSNRFVAMPSARNRSIGVQLFKYRIKGFLHWGYNFYYSRFSLLKLNPFLENDAYGAFPSGDAVSVYPGKNGPYPAIGLIVFNEALQDLRALKLLEKYMGYEQTVKFIEEILGAEISFDKCYSADRLLAMREAVNEMIEKFSVSEIKLRDIRLHA